MAAHPTHAADPKVMRDLAAFKFLVGATAHNAHVQHVARSLHEAEALCAYATAGADVARSAVLRSGRAALAALAPSVDRQLRRRRITEVPERFVHTDWTWEVPRLLASRLPRAERLEDWIWERQEKALDRRCAEWSRRDEVGGFLGVEYGALASLHAARACGKPAVVAFLSPHHKTRSRWVDVDFERHTGLVPDGRATVERLSAARDARRDEEAAVADWVETGSSFTTRSLVDAGVPVHKILTIPLGGPAPVPEEQLPVGPGAGVRFVYVGPVSIRKGAHYLLRTWPRVAARGAELHFYGKVLVSDRGLQDLQGRGGTPPATFHGSVPAADLRDVYLKASALVLPTLCDGFGMVVSEALAHGLPVITTSNAGAADLLSHGVNGFVIPPADEDALAVVLQWCIDHPDGLFRMRHAALASAARWTWGEFRQRHVEVLGRALCGR